MTFNSYLFILAFLPGMLIAYFGANRIGSRWGKLALVLGSALFYGYGNVKALIFLAASAAVNYGFALLIWHGRRKKALLFLPVAVNVALLLTLKYANFAIENFNALSGAQVPLRSWILPVGISFFTFQQIAYLVSVSREELRDCALLDYLAYILYFPKLLMGPLAEPADFMEQLNDPTRKGLNWEHLAEGLKMFSFGLFKKMVLADTFAAAVSWGFANAETATSMELILTMLSYTFEIYFDFSGYSDMAIGVSRMLNIELAMNFDSPYKALSIRDFWKRWHISLTKFLTKYIYIPLGGSRRGRGVTYLNTMIVFLISGLWHGANWTFLLWGALHGLLSIADRLFEKKESKLMETVRWTGTFACVNVLWLLFRAPSVRAWLQMLKRILKFESTAIGDKLIAAFELPELSIFARVLRIAGKIDQVRGFWMLAFFAAAFLICLIPENNYRTRTRKGLASMVFAAIAMVWSVLCLSAESVFVYFNF